MKYAQDVPKSYKYIELKFKWVKAWTNFYENLQKLVYLDVIENIDRKISSKEKIDVYSFFILVRDTLELILSN